MLLVFQFSSDAFAKPAGKIRLASWRMQGLGYCTIVQ
jgi:hypothetical protein